MSSMNFFEYAELVNKLNEWAALYDAGNSPVSDVVYDEEYKKLKMFERENPTMVIKDSPTQRVMASKSRSDDGFEKVEHRHPMLSIANINSHDEMRDWVSDKIAKGVKQVVMEFKIDGASLSLRYEGNNLEDAVTRGDGSTGDRVFANAVQVNGVMRKIPFDGVSEIRGEVVWFNDNFLACNDELAKIGKKTLSNPRNGAAGTMKSHDPMEVWRRKLNFIAYRIIEGCGDNRLHSDDMDQLGRMGFSTSPYRLFDLSAPDVVESIVKAVDEMDIERKSLPYLTDGLVIKVNDKNDYARLGGTAKCPHAFGAYKFPPEVKATQIIDVEASSGKTGIVTPVANLNPVSLSLTVVKRSTLHNWDMMEYLGFYDGCTVNVRKAGEIIPQIISVVGFEQNNRDEYEKITAMKNGRDVIAEEIAKLHAKNPNVPFISRPTHCKHCGTALVQDTNSSGESLVALICPNTKCPSLKVNLLTSFVEKGCMNIMNIGESTVQELVNAKLLKDYTDFFKLDKQTLMTLFSDRESERILDGINGSRNNFLNNLLNAFNIDGIGTGASQELADRYGALSAVIDATKNSPADIANTQKVGNEAANSLVKWFNENMDIVSYFVDNGIADKAKPKVIKGDALVGLTLIMTGTSDLVSRNSFKQYVQEQGGKLASSISGKVQYVLLGESAGPKKVKDIRDLQLAGNPIKTITDQEFLRMIGK